MVLLTSSRKVLATNIAFVCARIKEVKPNQQRTLIRRPRCFPQQSSFNYATLALPLYVSLERMHRRMLRGHYFLRVARTVGPKRTDDDCNGEAKDGRRFKEFRDLHCAVLELCHGLMC